MTFGEELKEARKKAGMTQEELAAAVYTTKTAISRYENNRRVPNGKIFVRLSIVLGHNFDMLRMAELAGVSGAEYHLGVEDAFDWLDKVFDDENHPANKSDPLTPDEREEQEAMKVKLLDTFVNKLNREGKIEALKRLDELAQISKYKNRKRKKSKPSRDGTP